MRDGESGDSNASLLLGLGLVVLVGWCIISKRINGVMRATGVDRAIFGSDVVDTRDGVAGRCMSMLYGKLPSSHVPQVGMLSSILFCIIGVYWLLRSLKVRPRQPSARPQRSVLAFRGLLCCLPPTMALGSRARPLLRRTLSSRPQLGSNISPERKWSRSPSSSCCSSCTTR